VNPPPLPTQQVQLTPAESAGIEGEPLPPATWDMWRWLMMLAVVALWAEWLLYYAARERQRAAEVREVPGDQPPPNSETVLDLEQDERGASAIRNPNLVGR
jgi:hypothetical protein